MNEFAQLAQIRNGKVEELRRELGLARKELTRKENALTALRGEIAAIARPIGGAFSDLAIDAENRRVYRREIESLQREIFAAHAKVFQTRHVLKRANVEYEKAAHLDREEKAEIALAAKATEEKRLDDAAINARYTLGLAR
jgi:flagellar biosynthesis chaperone FliJ